MARLPFIVGLVAPILTVALQCKPSSRAASSTSCVYNFCSNYLSSITCGGEVSIPSTIYADALAHWTVTSTSDCVLECVDTPRCTWIVRSYGGTSVYYSTTQYLQAIWLPRFYRVCRPSHWTASSWTAQSPSNRFKTRMATYLEVG